MLLVLLLMSVTGAAKFKVGLSMATLAEERWKVDRDLFKAEIEKLGGEVIVAAANGDENLQNSQAENLITQGVDVLVVIAQNGETASAIVNSAHKSKVPVIAYDRLIKNCDLDLYVSFDSVKVGELMAEYVCRLRPSGNYFIINGSPTDNNAHLVRQGFYNVLKKYPKIKVVFEQWCDSWSPEKALKHVENGLTQFKNDVQVILCANDGTCGGAVQALAEQKLAGKVLTTGQDAELAACKRIVAGTQAVTIYKPIKKLALAAAKATAELAAGKTPSEINEKVNNGRSDVPSIMLMPIQVDKNNMREVIVADGYHTEEEIYGK
ncbi:MAG: sugar ABC transporter substrate-binding protein [Firmicutes bacterium]|nr:sugar ABC transporter substrate-binding protein [Bacillota bacterium]